MKTKVCESRPAPSIRIRLFYWFGIYIAAQLPLIPWAYNLDRDLWPLFPMAMTWGFVNFISWLVPQSVFDAEGNQHATQTLQYCVWCLAFVLPWVTYVAHFICTLCVRNRRSFLILLWMLIGIVSLNIASCAYFFYAPPQ